MGTHPQFKNTDVPPHPVLPYITWGGRILTLHFDYVAGYTDPLILFFELTQLTPDEMTHLAFGNPPPPVLEKKLKGLQFVTCLTSTWFPTSLHDTTRQHTCTPQ